MYWRQEACRCPDKKNWKRSDWHHSHRDKRDFLYVWPLLSLSGQSVFVAIMCCRLFFFFPSRRRHTMLVSDWSSDVCSSDLRTSHHQSLRASFITRNAPSPSSQGLVM